MQRAQLVAASARLGACGRQSTWQEALALTEELKVKAVVLDLIFFNLLITVCQRAGQWQKALEVLKDLEGSGLEPQSVSYNAATSACASTLQWKTALGVLAKTEQQNCEDALTFNAAMSACEASWSRAMLLLRDMAQSKLKATAFSYSIAISHCEPWHLALLLLADAEASHAVDPVVYGAAVNACGKAQERTHETKKVSSF